jgi:hypothetical protein
MPFFIALLEGFLEGFQAACRGANSLNGNRSHLRQVKPRWRAAAEKPQREVTTMSADDVQTRAERRSTVAVKTIAVLLAEVSHRASASRLRYLR